MSISPSKRNLGTTWGKENSFLPRPRTYARSPSWICCCSTDYTVNPAFSESWVICVVDCVEGRLCHCTYLIIYYLPYTLLALCSKMINRQLSLSRVKIHRVLQNSIKPQSGIMQGCLQLRYNLDYTRNRRRDLTMQSLPYPPVIVVFFSAFFQVSLRSWKRQEPVAGQRLIYIAKLPLC